MMNPEDKKKNKLRRAGVGTGTTSLLMIFTVLCFATLAMLSLSTANSNRRIQRRTLERSQQLATAELKSAEQLAKIDAAIAEVQANDTDGQQYYQNVKDAVSGLGCETDLEFGTIIFQVGIDEQSELVTILSLMPPGNSNRYTIKTQASRMTDEWQPEPEGQLWTPTG